MANHALSSNPPNAAIDITTHGSDWLWAVFALMTLADLGMIAWSFTRPRGTRAFHHIAIVILTIAALDYFAMASDLGSTPITTEFRRRATRAIWYSRYIDYALTWPLLIIFLLLTTGVPLSELLITSFAALFMAVCLLIGALVQSSFKWGFFTFAVATLFYIWYHLLVRSSSVTGAMTNTRGANGVNGNTRGANANTTGANVNTRYRMHAGLLSFIWMLYPICWGLSEGGNVISPTSEMVFYGILDIIMKPVLLYAYVSKLNSIDYGNWGFQSGKASHFGHASHYGNAAPVVSNKEQGVRHVSEEGTVIA